MQVAINPSLYDTAQIYAKRQGINITMLIENFLERYIKSEEKSAQTPISITPKVARLKTGHSWNVSDQELDRMRYEYLAEKYK